MKKKVILSIVVIMSLSILGGCGKKEQTTVETSVDAVAVETVEETSVVEMEVESLEESLKETSEEETESVTEEVVDPTEEKLNNCFEKISRLKDAYNEIVTVAETKPLEKALQYDLEMLTFKSADLGTTADGLPFQSSFVAYATLSHYYDQFINDGGSYYDIAEWVKSQESSEYIRNNYLPGEFDNTLNATLLEAIALIPYIDTLEFGEIEETDAFEISGVKSAYIITLICNGEDIGMIAIFDAEGNLLNIDAGENFNYICTWESLE